MKNFEDFKSKCIGLVDLKQCESNTFITFAIPTNEIIKLDSYIDCDEPDCELIKSHDCALEFHDSVLVPINSLRELYDQLTGDQILNLKNYVLIVEEFEPTIHLYSADIVRLDSVNTAPVSPKFTEDFTDF